MLSRVADSIYWMNRYFERAENVARFVDVNHHLLLDLPEREADAWAAVLATTGDSALFRERYGTPTRESVLRFLTWDRDYPNSIVSCLRAARENARQVREVISSELWEQVNRTYLTVKEASPEEVLDTPTDFYASVKQASQLFVGIHYLTMTHNEAWHFGRMGRLIERADKTSRIVDVKYYALPHDDDEVRSVAEEIHWGALLKSASGFEMYRKRFGLITPAHAVEFLLLDPKFPRSVEYCVLKAERSLHAITGAPLGCTDTQAELKALDLRLHIEQMDIQSVLATGVHAAVDQIQARLNQLGTGVYETFFAVRAIAPSVSPPMMQWQRQS